MVPGGQDIVGKAAVIGQQHKAGAGLIQPPGREQLPPGVGVPYQVYHGGVTLISGSAHHPLGLIEHEVDEFLIGQQCTVHCHGVGILQLGVPFFAHRAVYLHAPFCQHGFGLAAGALGSFGQIFIQTHKRFSFVDDALSVT